MHYYHFVELHFHIQQQRPPQPDFRRGNTIVQIPSSNVLFYEKYCGLKLLLNSTSALFQLLKLKIRAMPYACLESCTNSKQKQVKRMLLPPSTHP